MRKYGYKFQAPEGGAPPSASLLQEVTGGGGIIFGLVFVFLSDAVEDPGGTLTVSITVYITSVFYFYMMAKFAEDWPRTARWLIAVPAGLVGTLFLAAIMFASPEKPAEYLIGFFLAFLYFLVIVMISAYQLHQMKRTK